MYQDMNEMWYNKPLDGPDFFPRFYLRACYLGECIDISRVFMSAHGVVPFSVPLWRSQTEGDRTNNWLYCVTKSSTEPLNL